MKANQFLMVLALTAVSATAFADGRPRRSSPGGDGTGNGGSPILLRTKLIKEYINSSLRDDALSYMSNLRLDLIKSPVAQAALKRMIEQDILSDIHSSSYVLQPSCKAIGGQDEGGAINGELGGDICFSPQALARHDASKAEILGLAIHEHAHHFGFEDRDYAIYKAVYESARLDNPAWSDAEQKPVPPPVVVVPVPDPVPPMFPEPSWDSRRLDEARRLYGWHNGLRVRVSYFCGHRGVPCAKPLPIRVKARMFCRGIWYDRSLEVPTEANSSDVDFDLEFSKAYACRGSWVFVDFSSGLSEHSSLFEIPLLEAN